MNLGLLGLATSSLAAMLVILLALMAMVGLGIAISRVSKGGLSTHYAQLMELGLQPDPNGEATGTLAGKPAWAGEVRSEAHGMLCVLRLSQLPVDLALRSGGSTSKQVRCGDPRLDQAWTIGSRSGGVGRLHATVRDGLLYLGRLSTSVVLHEGILEVSCATPGQLLHAMSVVRTLIPLLSGDAHTLLADRAQNDVNPKVRAQMLWELAQHDRDKARIVAASRDTSGDWSPEELVLMGELLNGDRHCLMRAMTHADTKVELGFRAATTWLRVGGEPALAVRTIASTFGMVGVLKLAEHMRNGKAEDIDALRPYVAVVLERKKTRDPELRTRTLVALACAMEAHPLESSRAALILIATQGPGLAQRVAVSSLGRVGEVADVAALRAVQAGLMVTEFATSHLIDTAVALIQSRAGGNAGALSLAVLSAEVGALSEAAPMAEEDDEPQVQARVVRPRVAE